MRGKTGIRAVALLLLLLGRYGPAPGSVFAAQTITGTLSGKVINPDGNPIPDVLVNVINLGNGFAYGKKTDARGVYRIDFLPAGEYRITAEKDGFASTVIPRYLAEVNREKFLQPPPIQLIPLPTGTISGAPNVATSGLLQVNGADPALRGNLTAEFLDSLPLPGIRSFDLLGLLIPGVSPPQSAIGSVGPGIGPGIVTPGQFSVNGGRTRANNFTIDGSDNNDQEFGVRRSGFVATVAQPVETITEFQISTLLPDAETGRNSGGHVNVVSKSGGNEFSGELHSRFADSRLNARDFFDLSAPGNPTKNPATRTQSGAVVGFPILRNRLEFLGAFEQQTVNRVEERHFPVPTASDRRTRLDLLDVRSLLGRDLLDPAFYPLPNNPGGPYGSNTLTQILPASGRGSVFSIKFDGQFKPFGKPSTVSARYNFSDDRARLPVVDGALRSAVDADTGTKNAALSLNTELSTRLSNQFRFSVGLTSLEFSDTEQSPFVFQTKSQGVDRTGDGVPDGRSGPVGRIVFAPFASVGIDPFSFPQARESRTFQFADTGVWTRGPVTLKFGADIRRVHLDGRLERNYRTQITFSPGFVQALNSGTVRVAQSSEIAALGLPNDIFQALAVTPDALLNLRFSELNFFQQAQVRLHPRVNFEFGLRVERNTVPTDATGKLERSLTIKDSDLPPFDSSSAFAQVFLNALNAQRRFLDGRNKIHHGDDFNFAPRVGVAWDLTGHGRTALRAGYGIFYDPILGSLVSQSRNAFPNFIPVNFGSGILFSELLGANPAFIRFGEKLDVPLIRPGTINTVGLPTSGFVEGIGQLLTVGGFFVGTGFGAGITLPEKNIKTPLTHHYSASFEQVVGKNLLLSVAYVGTTGRRLLRVRTPNGGNVTPIVIRTLRGAAPLIQPRLERPDSALGAVTVFESSARSNYNALQASLTKHLESGLGLQFGYTYSHALDDVSDIFDSQSGFAVAQDELGRNGGLRTERASADFDIRHRLTAAWVWDAPSGGIRLFSNIRLSGILTLQTGQPFTVNTALDVNFDGNPTDRLGTTSGLIVSDSGRTRISVDPRTNPLSLLAFDGGAVGRNTFRTSGVASLDLAIQKTVEFGSGLTTTFRVEGFNLFNRTHFGVPVRILESPGFGSSVNTSLPARNFQIAVKLSF